MAAPSAQDLPDTFVHRMTTVLGSRDALEAALGAHVATTIRPNPLKADPRSLRRRLEALGLSVGDTSVSSEAWAVADPLDRSLGTLWEHQAGHFMVQDAASLLPVMALDPRPGERVLDLCAAPGGKTTHLSQRMGNEGLVVANEARRGRLAMLGANLDRLGCLNVVVTRGDGRHRRWPTFDKVLVDAPCSNLGALHEDTRLPWSHRDDVSLGLARLQRDLLAAAYRATREGGTIVYSTCTLEAHENEAVADWFLAHHDVEVVPFAPGIGRPGLTEVGDEHFHGDIAATLRVHPGDAATGGFYVARFRKTGPHAPRPTTPRPSDFDVAGAAPVHEVRALYGLDDALPAHATATRTRRRLFVTTVPDAAAALALGAERVGTYLATDEDGEWRLGFDAATSWGRGATAEVRLDRATARAWAAGADVDATRGTPWSVLTCDGEPVGASRSYGTKLLNFVPKERRVPEGPPDRFGFLARPGR